MILKIVSNCNIAIIGAGPAGCSCAIALLKAGVGEVALIDNSKTGKFHIGESIPPNMNQVFRQLGIYEAFVAEGHEPCYGSCSYWGNDRKGYNDSILSPFGHGWHLDRATFNDFLVHEAVNRGAKIFKHSYQSSIKTESGHQLIIKNEYGNEVVLDASFVVDASGTRSVFATERGSKKTQDTPLVCLGQRFKAKGEIEVSKLTHLESVEHGWWYAARVPGQQLLVTLYTNADTVKKHNLQLLKNWTSFLHKTQNTSKWIKNLKPGDGKLLGFSATSFCLDKIVGKNWIAIGDAASSYDPITSQGIIKSITQGIQAAEIIANTPDISLDRLRDFEKEVHSQYSQYEKMREYFYNLEQRWSDSLFWKSMHNL